MEIKTTIDDLIAYVDDQIPNSHTNESKMRWLNEIETQIYNNIILTHEGYENVEFEGYTNETDGSTQLIVPAEYSELYRYWLEKSIYMADRDTESATNALGMFQSYYDNYFSAYNRKHRPLSAGKIRIYKRRCERI